MTKRERQLRVQQASAELLELIRASFPLIDHVSTEVRPTGTVILSIYSPYENLFDILEATGTRLADFSANDNIHFVIRPLRSRSEKAVAKQRNVAA